MRKKDFVAVIADELGLTQREVDIIVSRFLRMLGDELVSNEDPVKLHGFGTFSQRDFRRENWTNPRTGEQSLLVTKNIGFIPSTLLKKRMNEDNGFHG